MDEATIVNLMSSTHISTKYIHDILQEMDFNDALDHCMGLLDQFPHCHQNNISECSIDSVSFINKIKEFSSEPKDYCFQRKLDCHGISRECALLSAIRIILDLPYDNLFEVSFIVGKNKEIGEYETIVGNEIERFLRDINIHFFRDPINSGIIRAYIKRNSPIPSTIKDPTMPIDRLKFDSFHHFLEGFQKNGAGITLVRQFKHKGEESFMKSLIKHEAISIRVSSKLTFKKSPDLTIATQDTSELAWVSFELVPPFTGNFFFISYFITFREGFLPTSWVVECIPDKPFETNNETPNDGRNNPNPVKQTENAMIPSIDKWKVVDKRVNMEGFKSGLIYLNTRMLTHYIRIRLIAPNINGTKCLHINSFDMHGIHEESGSTKSTMV